MFKLILFQLIISDYFIKYYVKYIFILFWAFSSVVSYHIPALYQPLSSLRYRRQASKTKNNNHYPCLILSHLILIFLFLLISCNHISPCPFSSYYFITCLLLISSFLISSHLISSPLLQCFFSTLPVPLYSGQYKPPPLTLCVHRIQAGLVYSVAHVWVG